MSDARESARYDGLPSETYAVLAPQDFRFPDDAYHEATSLATDGPVLELGCGNGRILWRLLPVKKDVEGIDASIGQLEVGWKYASDNGFDPNIIRFGELATFEESPRFARLFCADGTFMLTGTCDEGVKALQCCYRALRPSGVLSLSLAEEAPDSDGAWRIRHAVRKGPVTYILQEARTTGSAPQTHLALKRIDKFDRNGVSVDSSTRLHVVRWWRPEEIAAAMREVGFSQVEHKSIGLPDTWITEAVK